MMETFFGDYLEQLERLHNQIEQAIADLPPAALDWTPAPDTNSLGVLVVHVAGSQRYWIGDVIAREPSGRHREAEFQTRGLDATTLQARLADVLNYTRAVVGRLALDDLAAARVSSSDGRTVTVGWTLAHVLEHTALHVGHMQLTRQWWKYQSI